jgi:predicted RND superfamily exporter protein
MLQRLSALYRTLIISHPIATLLAILLVTILAVIGLPNFKLDASADSLTLENDTDIDYFREINQRYQYGDVLVVTYTPNGDLFSDHSIDVMQRLRDELVQVQGVENVVSMIDVPLLYSPRRSLAEQKESTRTLLTEGVDRDMVREEFLTSPIYRSLILGPDGRTTALLLNLKVDNHYIDLVRHRDSLRLKSKQQGLDSAEAAELEKVSQEFLDYRTQLTAKDHARVEQVRNIVAGYQSEARLFVGGVSMITADMIAYIKSDLVIFGSAILLFIVLILAIIFRQLRFVLLPLFVCVATVLMMLGWLAWIDWRLTVISSNFVALLLIMTLAITIHLVVRYREFHAENPAWDKQQLVWETVKFMALPCFYTVITSIVAFVSLVVSDIRPVMDFGWMMSIGLSLAMLLAFLVLPATLMILPKGEAKDKKDNSAAFTLRFSRIAENHGSKVVAISVIAAVVSLYGISKLEVENRFIDYFHKHTEIYQGMSVIDQQLGGTVSLEILLDANPIPASTPSASVATEEADPFAGESAAVEDGAFDEDDPFGDDPFSDDAFATDGESAQESYWFSLAGLDEIRKLHLYLESLPEVGKVNSLATFYEVAEDINGGRLNNFELGVVRNMLSEDISNFLVKPYLSDEHNQARITLRVMETSPELKRVELVEKIRNYAVNEVGFQPQQVHFTGMLVLYNNMLQSLFQSQIATMGAVFVGIMLMFLVLIRSVSLSLIAILPNMLAASVVLGGMGLAGVPLDMMTITIAAITVGIGVDHAIHYIYRFRKEFALTGNYVEAMHNSHASIGRALYYTAITIVVGFSILALSQFIPSIYFGVFTAIAMIAALLGSLTLLPKLILMVKPLGKEQ